MKPIGPPFTGHVGRVFVVAFSSDGRTVASGGTDRKTILWDTWRHVSNSRRAEATETSFKMAFSPNGVFEAEGYDAAMLVIDALKRSGADKAVSKEKITAALRETRDFPGVMGPIIFDAKGQVIAVASKFVLIRNNQG